MSAGEGPAEGDSGSVLRLIHKHYYRADLPLAVQPEAFRPTASDDDGLSVYLDGEATPEQAVQVVPPEKRHLYCVASIPLQGLQQLGLSVLKSPGVIPGHAVIPELNCNRYQREKAACKEIQKRLAELASANIVLQPPPE